MRRANEKREPVPEPVKTTAPESRAPGVIRDILGGYFLTAVAAGKHLSFLLFLTFLGLIYIANSYYAEKTIRNIDRIQHDLKEMRYEYISNRSALMQGSRQSSIARKVAGMGVRESTVPPAKIFIQDNH
ncbi:MAG: hypothetical protein JW861_12925 [Bacteroidales bacterium]|nr:hypothetical protein [Bacteroidales bacterium]